MSPSINSMIVVSHALRKMQHGAMRDAIIFERAGEHEPAKSLRLQADDFHQVATMLEERVETLKPKTRKVKAV